VSNSDFLTKTFSKSSASLKKKLKFLHFFATVADVVTFGLHNFCNYLQLCCSIPENTFRLKLKVKIFESITISCSRNTRFAIQLLPSSDRCVLCYHKATEM
jgi:hypothetical protein